MDELSFTERELDVMSALWRRGSGTVAEVRAALPDAPSYTGVLKLLQILEEKGMVRHEQEGRAYRYHPVVEKEEAGGHALRRVVEKIFHGSTEMALARLVTHGNLSRDELERMHRLLTEAVEEAEEG
jgi:predicted transcriptional regulator